MACNKTLVALLLVLGLGTPASVHATNVKVTPIEKVLTLLEDLQAEVEAEGKEEAETYDTFACFCKDTTQEKSEAITEGQDEIDEQAATLEEKTALEKRLTVEIEELNKEIAD